MLPRTAIGVLVFLFAAVVGCGEGGKPEPTPDLANLTVEEVYARFAEAINQPGSIYQVTIDMEEDAEGHSMEGTVTMWVDVGRDLVREEGDGEMRSEERGMRYKWKRITTGGREYKYVEQPEDEKGPGTTVDARTCYGANAAVSVVLQCPGWRGDTVTEVQIREHDGDSAIALVTAEVQRGGEETPQPTMTLYLNVSDFLPIAIEGNGTFEDPRSWGSYQFRWAFANRFVPAWSVPDDFFEPASIGCVEPSGE